MAKVTDGALGGIALYSAGIFLFAVNDALGKWLLADYGVGQLMAIRFVGTLFVLVPALWLHRARWRRPPRPLLQAARVACSAVDTYCFYEATRTLPLADVMTFYLAAPLIVVAMSRFALGERVGPMRWAAVLAGFGGVLVALRPTGAALSPGALVALFGSVLFAATLTTTRQLRDTHWLQLVGFQFAGAGLAGALVAPLAWVDPSPRDWLLMFAVGLVSMASFLCIIGALKVTAASLLAPFQYLSIVWAALLGWLVWGDVPSGPIVAGGAVIIASGLAVIGAERLAAAS